MLDPVLNFAKVIVSIGYDAAATSIVLSAGEGALLPAPATAGAFNLVWWNFTDYQDPSDDPNKEIVRCTARTTDTLTVTRAQESTTATTKNTGGKVYKMILAMTKKMIDDIGTIKLNIDQTTPQTTVGTFTFLIVHTPTLNGGILANDDITIQGTTHATRDTSYVILQPSGGNVGIGTTGPVSKLHIHGNYSNDGTGGFTLDATDTADPEKYVLRINPFVVGGGKVGYQFQTKSFTSGTNVPLTFGNAGNVGIGTVSPTSILALGGTSARTFQMERNVTTNTAGQNLTVLAGGATNLMVATVSITVGGTGYTVNDVLTLATPTGGTAATVTVTSVAAGVVDGISLTTKGSLYTTGTKATTVAPAGGTGCTINVLTLQSATNKAGGSLILQGGISTGTGTSGVKLQASPAGASGAADNAVATMVEVSGNTLGFYAVTPVVRPTALTTQLTTITATAPGTPDYAIADLTVTSPYGFVSADEGQSVLKVILNLQTRVAELETKLKALGLLT